MFTLMTLVSTDVDAKVTNESCLTTGSCDRGAVRGGCVFVTSMNVRRQTRHYSATRDSSVTDVTHMTAPPAPLHHRRGTYSVKRGDCTKVILFRTTRAHHKDARPIFEGIVL